MAHLRVSQFGVIHLGHKVTGRVLQILLRMIFIIPGTGKDKLILHISQPSPFPCYSPLSAHGSFSSYGGNEGDSTLVEDIQTPIYIQEAHLGRSGKALATSFYLSLSQTSL